MASFKTNASSCGLRLSCAAKQQMPPFPEKLNEIPLHPDDDGNRQTGLRTRSCVSGMDLHAFCELKLISYYHKPGNSKRNGRIFKP
eukprot:1968539-Amphidinium_carterae.1